MNVTYCTISDGVSKKYSKNVKKDKRSEQNNRRSIKNFKKSMKLTILIELNDSTDPNRY